MTQNCSLTGKTKQDFKMAVHSAFDNYLWLMDEDLATVDNANELRESINGFITTMRTYDSEDRQELINIFWERVEYWGMAGLLDIEGKDLLPFISDANFRAYVNEGVGADPTPFTDTEERLEKINPASQRKQANLDYLQRSYGEAKDERTRVEQALQVDICAALYVDRGNSPLQTNSRITLSNAELNAKLKALQQIYFNRVLRYLHSVNADAFPNEAEEMYKDGKYTNAVHKYERAASRYFTYTSAELKKLSAQRSSDRAVAQQLDAYAAWLHLRNFDSMLAQMTADGITYEHGTFGDMNFNKEYALATKGSSNPDNWNNKETLEISQVISKPVQILINTTPLISYKNGESLGEYCSFQDVVRNVISIKQIPYIGNNVFFDSEFVRKLLNKVSEETLDYIEGRSLHAIIYQWRVDSQRAMRAVFELLANKEVYKLLEDADCFRINAFSQLFTEEDRNIIASINAGIMADTQNSLYGINKAKNNMSKKNLFFYIALAFDTIGGINFLQYYLNENNEIATRNLRGSTLSLLEYQAKQSIRTSQSYETGVAQVHKDMFNEKLEGNKFKLLLDKNMPNTEITVDLRNFSVTIPKNCLGYKKKIYDMLFAFTGLRLTEEMDLPPKVTPESVLMLSARMAALQAIQLEVTTKAEKKNEVVSKDHIKNWLAQYNVDMKHYKIRNTGELDLIPSADTAIFRQIVYAIGKSSGRLSSNQVHAGGNKKLSAATTSRLNNNVLSLIHLLNSKANSATSNLSLARSGLFDNLYTSKEFVKDSDAVQNDEFSAGEYASSLLLYLFIDGLREHKEDPHAVIGSGIIGFFPSVNSDKSTINCLTVNGKKAVVYTGTIAEFAQVLAEGKLLDYAKASEVNFRNFLRIIQLAADLFSDDPKVVEALKPYTRIISNDDIVLAFKELTNEVSSLRFQIAELINNFGQLYQTLGKEFQNKMSECKLFVPGSTSSKELLTLTNSELDNFTKLELGNAYYNSYCQINNDFKKLLRASKDILGIDLSTQNHIDDCFSTLNAALWKIAITKPALGKNPVDIIKNLCREYNLKHRQHPIKLIDLTHYIAVNGELYANTTLVANLYRYSTDETLRTKLASKYSGLLNIDQFNARKEAELLGSLVKARFSVDLLSGEAPIKWIMGEDGKINKTLSDKYGIDISSFIDTNLKKLKLGKFKFSSLAMELLKSAPGASDKLSDTVSILDLYDKTIFDKKVDAIIEEAKKRIETLESKLLLATDAEKPVIAAEIAKYKALCTPVSSNMAYMANPALGTLTLNPLILRYNKLHTVMTLSYMFLTVGSAMNHPNKGFNSLASNSLKHKNVHLSNVTETQNGTFIVDNALLLTVEHGDLILDIKSNTLLEVAKTEDQVLIREYKSGFESSVLADASRSDEATKFFIEDEAARFQAQHKRNVSNTATMKEFTLNSVDGIPSEYNVAVIDDVYASGYNVSGEIEGGIKPYDGAMWVHPALVWLENNALGGDRAGFTKKHFCHYVDEATGTAGIIKTCGFAIRNSNMRTLPTYLNIFRKMSNHKWLDLSGNLLTDFDITKDYFGREFLKDEQQGGSIWGLKEIIFKKRGKYYKVTNIINKGNNLYDIQGCELTGIQREESLLNATYTGGESGIIHLGHLFSGIADVQVSGELVTIDTNWALWNVLGGHNSLTRLGDQLIGSETSIENLCTIMNRTGFAQKDHEGKIMEPLCLDEVFQPLKHSDVHYLVSAGAMKHGTGNMNPASRYTNNEAFDFFRVKMQQIGIQLDKEHHADNEELSLMTQVISACAHRGFTQERCMNLYRSLAKLAELEGADLLKPLEQYLSHLDQASKDDLVVAAIQKVVEAAAKSGDDDANVINSVAQDLIDIVHSGNKLTKKDIDNSKLPIDDPAIYSQFVKEIVLFLNRGIRLKIPGQLNVLTPSYDLFKTYDGKTWSEIENLAGDKTPEDYLAELQATKLNFYQGDNTDWTNCEVGKSYKIIWEENGVLKDHTYELKTPLEYYALQQFANTHNTISIVEDITKGKNLGCYNVKFEAIATINGVLTRKKYQLYDFDAVRALFELENVESGDDTAISEWYGKWSHVLELTSAIPALSKNSKKNLATRCRIAMQNNLLAISSAGDATISNGIMSTNNVYINGIPMQVDKSTVKKYAYELVVPKRDRDQYGFSDEDNLHKITSKDFFFNLLLGKFQTSLIAHNYDIQLKKPNGKHISIISKEHFEDTLDRSENLRLQPAEFFSSTVNDKLYVSDRNGNLRFQIQQDDFLAEDPLGNEIIVTDNPAFYINDQEFCGITLSPAMTADEMQNYINNLNLDVITNPAGISWLEWAKSVSPDKFYAYQKLLDGSKEDLKKIANTHPYLRTLLNRANALKNSFETTLDVVVSRTPSLSMQSFMGMRIVAFENENLNNAYVSHAQIWLQGSDYDVDAASIALYEVDASGLLYTWSPFTNLTDEKSTLDSLELPFPTFEEKETVTYDQLTDEEKQLFIDTTTKIVQLIDEAQLKAEQEAVVTETDPINPIETTKTGKLIYNDLQLLTKIINLANKLPAIVDVTTVPDLVQSINNQDEQARINQIYKDVNYHNTWLKRQNARKQEFAAMNYSMHLMYEIIMDPSNLIQSMKSVDGVTGPAKKLAKKSVKGAAIAVSTPGNFMNMVESANANAVGKKAIGICAVSLKDFFALTAYFNDVVENGTPEQKRLLTKEVTFEIPDENGQMTTVTKSVLANTLLRDFGKKNLKISDDPVILLKFQNLLEQIDQDSDAAILLSAMLSLATDNAKELVLDRLNANPQMISLYLYGVTVGLSLEQCASIIMSDVGNLFDSLLKGNSFGGVDACSSLNNIFKYFEEFPKELLQVYLDTTSHYRIGEDYNSPSINYTGYFKMLYCKVFGKGSIDKFKDLITLILGKPQETFKNLVNSDLIAEINRVGNAEDRVMLHRLLRDLRVYAGLCNVIKLNEGLYKSMKTLSDGASELFTLGLLLGLNQGLSPSTLDTLSKISVFESIMNFEDEPLNLSKFVNDPEYRLRAIAEYESAVDYKKKPIKKSFNILACLAEVPLYFAYLKLLSASADVCKESSARFATIEKLFKTVKDDYGIYTNKDKESFIRGLNNYYTFEMYNSFLRHGNGSEGGNPYNVLRGVQGAPTFKNGKLEGKLDSTSDILLGTADGNAAFKYYMEQIVIPKLQERFPNNIFIANLCIYSSDKNPAHRAVTYYTLPINMMPTTDDERLAFLEYQNAFNALTTEAFTVGDLTIKISDLMFLYALVAHSTKLGPESLMPIFRDNRALHNSLASLYGKYVSYYTLNRMFEKESSILPASLDPWVVPVKNSTKAAGNSLKNCYIYNKETNSYDLYHRTDEGWQLALKNTHDVDKKYRIYFAINPVMNTSQSDSGSAIGILPQLKSETQLYEEYLKSGNLEDKFGINDANFDDTYFRYEYDPFSDKHTIEKFSGEYALSPDEKKYTKLLDLKHFTEVLLEHNNLIPIGAKFNTQVLKLLPVFNELGLLIDIIAVNKDGKLETNSEFITTITRLANSVNMADPNYETLWKSLLNNEFNCK